jgi:hypothetical protein
MNKKSKVKANQMIPNTSSRIKNDLFHPMSAPNKPTDSGFIKAETIRYEVKNICKRKRIKPKGRTLRANPRDLKGENELGSFASSLTFVILTRYFILVFRQTEFSRLLVGLKIALYQSSFKPF